MSTAPDAAASETGGRLLPQRQDHDLEVLLATPLHRYLGIVQVDPDDPGSGLTLEVRAELANNSQMLHGGLVSTCLDVAAAYAVFPELADHEVVLTNSLAISYLRPVPVGSQVRMSAQILRRGRGTAFLESTVTRGGEPDGPLVAVGQVVKTIVDLDAS